MIRPMSLLRKHVGVGAALALLSSLGAGFQSCDNKKFEECPKDNIIGSWGVTKYTDAFGEFDSLFYLINPVRNVSDSLYFNGNYTDSYYHADSTRVTLRYTLSDSIIFYIDRMYAVQTNPPVMIMEVLSQKDSTLHSCELKLKRDTDNDRIFRCGPDSMFRRLLLDGDILKFTATNGPATSEPEGSQNYEFFLDVTGFSRAISLADSLNNPSSIRNQGKKDSLKTKDKTSKMHISTKKSQK